MATAAVNFRMDANLKRDMEETCKAMGLSMATAFTMFATKVTREQRIPFEIAADPFFSAANMEYVQKSVDELRAGKGKVHELIEE